MDKEIVFECSCPICGKKIGRRHGVLCDDCKTTRIQETLTGESLTKIIDEIIKIQMEEKFKELTENNQVCEVKIEPIDWNVIRGQMNYYAELERRKHEK